MSDWWTASMKLQQQMLDAQKASLEAGQKALGAGEQMLRMQRESQKALDANMAAWAAWAKLWGLG